jgi:hypothetical protein
MSKNNARAAAFAIFNSHLPSRKERGNTAFRKAVIVEIMEAFDCTLSSASTYYNTAFKEAKLKTPELVEGLGRPAGKNNGGRKAKIVVNVIDRATGEVVAKEVSRNAAAEMIALAAARNEPELEAVMVMDVPERVLPNITGALQSEAPADSQEDVEHAAADTEDADADADADANIAEHPELDVDAFAAALNINGAEEDDEQHYEEDAALL